MERASCDVLDAVRKSMRQVRAAIGAATVNPDLSRPPSRCNMREIVVGETET